MARVIIYEYKKVVSKFPSCTCIRSSEQVSIFDDSGVMVDATGAATSFLLYLIPK